MAIRQYLAVVQEPSFNPVTLTTPTFGTNAIWVRLDVGNAFTMREVPTMVTVPSGGGIAVNAFKVSDKHVLAGRLSVILCQSQVKFLLDWASTRINSGGTAPWTITQSPLPVGDLASCTILHAIQYDGGTTYNLRAYSGVKVAGWDLDVSEESQIWRLNLDLIGAKPSVPSTFDPPTSSVFPTDPYFFKDLNSTGLTIGTARASFSSLRISSRNALQAWHFANTYAQRIGWFGRTTTVEAQNVYTAITDRSNFEALTTFSASVVLTTTGHTSTLNMNTVNILNAVADNLPNEGVYFQGLTMENMWDPAAASGVGEDLHWAFT